MYPLYERTNNNISVALKKSKHVPPHLHNAIELVYVTEGALEFGLGEELYHMETGDFAIAFPDVIRNVFRKTAKKLSRESCDKKAEFTR